MIKLTTYKNKLHYVGFQIEGHANYSEIGTDIVCAAVSILSQTCVNAIQDILKVEFRLKENADRGLVELIVKDQSNDKMNEVSLLIESMELGIRGVSELYPSYVKVNLKEVAS